MAQDFPSGPVMVPTRRYPPGEEAGVPFEAGAPGAFCSARGSSFSPLSPGLKRFRSRMREYFSYGSAPAERAATAFLAGAGPGETDRRSRMSTTQMEEAIQAAQP